MRLAALSALVLCACNTTGRQRVEWFLDTKVLPASAQAWRAGEGTFVG